MGSYTISSLPLFNASVIPIKPTLKQILNIFASHHNHGNAMHQEFCELNGSPQFHSGWCRKDKSAKISWRKSQLRLLSRTYQIPTLHSEHIPSVTSFMLSLHTSISFYCLYSVSLLGQELLGARDHVVFMSVYSIPGTIYGKYLLSFGKIGIRGEIRKCVLSIVASETLYF